MAVTPEYVEYLKKIATWEVADYEDNVFKRWTLSEFQELIGDHKPDQVFDATLVETKSYLPSSVNWANSECIHKILNQKNCESCWAFAAAASDKCCIENYPKYYGWLPPQELLSCDKGDDENNNCNGGYALNAFSYI